MTPEARAAVDAVARVLDPDRAVDDGEVPAALRARAENLVAALGRAPRPQDLGAIHEALLSVEARSAGAHYTAADLARALIDVTAPAAWLAGGPRRVWDPACGGGAFLLAAADALLEAGHDPRRIVEEMLFGTDLDAGAVEITGEALRWWARLHGSAADPATHVAVGDALGGRRGGFGHGFDLVVGNPPFQGQLSGRSVRDAGEVRRLRDRWGDAVGAYTDTAALFLVAAADALCAGGRVCLILPMSVLAARDSATARRTVEQAAELTGLWVAGEAVFEAAVEVCAPVLMKRSDADGDRTRDDAPVRRWRGRSVEALAAGEGARGAGTVSAHVAASGSGSWAVHALAALGVPDPCFDHDGSLAEIVTCAAGFRDEFYGLVGHVVEATDELGLLGPDDERWPQELAALVTTGSIDIGRHSWGERDTRFAGSRFRRPVVDRRRVPEGSNAERWANRTARPKVLVATQTAVGEAAVDVHGNLLPSTPVVAAFADPARLWEVASVVCSPLASVVALARGAGTGRAARMVRHTTTSVAALPLPVDRGAWSEGAAALEGGDRPAFMAAMNAAYRVVGEDARELGQWWSERGPRRQRA